MKIRLAETSDLPAICRLYNEFFVYNAEQQPQYYKNAVETGSYPKSVLESDTEDIFVVMDNSVAGTGAIVGLIHITEEHTPPYDCFIQHSYATIIDLFVTKNDRSKGVGGLLLDAAKQWAKARKLDYIELNVLAENKNGFQFYNHEHFKTVSQVMRYTL